jgi:hypothetical protein
MSDAKATAAHGAPGRLALGAGFICLLAAILSVGVSRLGDRSAVDIPGNDALATRLCENALR